jgi:uncharacterized protein
MNRLVRQKLNGIEEGYDLKILYACESGSRAWGFPSRNSDYDVRFIYIKPVKWYLSVGKRADTLTLPVNGELDINGWDIRKVLAHIARPNPVVYEWLQSPIVYVQFGKIREELLSLSESYYSRKEFLRHYLGTARSAMKSIDDHDFINIKKFFYLLRSLLAASWVLRRDSIPPMELCGLMEIVEDATLAEKITCLVAKKADTVEACRISLDPAFKPFFDEVYETCSEKQDDLESVRTDPGILDDFLMKLFERTGA